MDRAEDERARLLEGAVERGTERALAKYDQQRSGEIQISGPFGIKLGGRGRAVLTVVIIAAILAGLYIHDGRTEASSNQRSHEHMQLEERLNEVVYVLTLSQEQRERLNLAVPESLRRKQIERNPRP
jgi:hypothetical protein